MLFKRDCHMIREDIEELKKQQALTSQAVENHMENEEVLMKAHNEKLDNIIHMIKEDREDNKKFRKDVGENYTTKEEFNSFKRAISWVVFALITFASGIGGIYAIYSDIQQRFENRLHHYEEMRDDGKNH